MKDLVEARNRQAGEEESAALLRAAFATAGVAGRVSLRPNPLKRVSESLVPIHWAPGLLNLGHQIGGRNLFASLLPESPVDQWDYMRRRLYVFAPPRDSRKKKKKKESSIMQGLSAN